MAINALLPGHWLLKSLGASSLLLTVSLAVAQPSPYYQHPRSDSSQGYWKLYTDYNTRVTRVNFYTNQDELLYQEKLKDRYIKLTNRTIRRFDDLLNRLVERNLLAGQVKSYDLLASNQWTAVPKETKSAFDEVVIPAASASSSVPRVKLEIVSTSQLKLSYLNPASERLLITLANESYQYFFKNQSTLQHYAGLLTISHLPTGTYYLGVDGPKKRVKYQLIIDQESRSIQLNPLLNQFNP